MNKGRLQSLTQMRLQVQFWVDHARVNCWCSPQRRAAYAKPDDVHRNTPAIRVDRDVVWYVQHN